MNNLEEYENLILFNYTSVFFTSYITLRRKALTTLGNSMVTLLILTFPKPHYKWLVFRVLTK